MDFFRDCCVAPTVGSSVLVRQHGRSLCTKVHSGSPCSASLNLLPWRAFMSVFQEQKTDQEKTTIFRGTQFRDSYSANQSVLIKSRQ
ncbi:MAG: hypothetical protein ACI9V8_001612 [Urechidicola sp.]|jgi:hypothetical protein